MDMRKITGAKRCGRGVTATHVVGRDNELAQGS